MVETMAEYLKRPYNYDEFDMAIENAPFGEFASVNPAGTKAPSFPLERLSDGETVEMKDLWKRGLAVIEFGSFT